MSHRATNWAITQRGVEPAVKIVLWYLADCHNNHTGLCNPSQSRLAEDCEMSRRTVNRHLAKLEELGLIRRNRATNSETMQRQSTEYELALDGIFDAADEAQIAPETGEDTPEPCANLAHGHVPSEVDPMCHSYGTLYRTRKLTRKKEPPTPKPEPDVLEVLTEVLSSEAAQAFIDHRRAKNARLTLRAAVLIVAKLRGNPRADEIVETSIMNGWTGVFPEKQKINGGRNEQSSRQQFDIAHREYCRRLSAGEIHRGPDPSDPFAQ